jgi:acylaminoacyl-peptidase
MVGTTDIPDWCFLEIYGKEGKNSFTESPSADILTQFYQKSPISHISKVYICELHIGTKIIPEIYA